MKVCPGILHNLKLAHTVNYDTKFRSLLTNPFQHVVSGLQYICMCFEVLTASAIQDNFFVLLEMI